MSAIPPDPSAMHHPDTTDQETLPAGDSGNHPASEALATADALTTTATTQARDFEDLTLAEVSGLFFQAPRQTLTALLMVAGVPATARASVPVALPAIAAPPPELEDDLFYKATRQDTLRFLMCSAALIFAVLGTLIMVSAETRFESRQLVRGIPFILIAFILWLRAEIAYPRRNTTSLPGISPAQARLLWEDWPLWRSGFILLAGVFALFAWSGTTNNEFTAEGFWTWLLSIVCITLAFVPVTFSPLRLWQHFQAMGNRFKFRQGGTLIALVAILLIGTAFRVYDFYGIPPEMTSDHKEKLLDAYRIANGSRDIFFVNNGGREAAQFYMLAILSHVPGLQLDHSLLKLLATAESLVTLPVLWWMGRAVIGPRHSRLGNIVGLCLAALVAVSYWHVSITRLALRIVLTPLIAALLIIFLSRGMRSHRRTDFVYAGLVLGFGLYCYQAVRMLPVVVIAAGVILLMMSRPAQRARVILNFSVLVLVSFIVFVPLFRFSLEYPQFFWMRTTGRLLGDELIQETAEDGTIQYRDATITERFSAFTKNIPVLTSNVRNALLMFNWKGDVAWINGYPNYPQMDILSGALLIVGLASWGVLCHRTRDPVYLLIPVTVLIMLLPSALSIAQPIENPSATRTSGALPAAYLLAAFPLALLVVEMRRQVRGIPGWILAVFLAGGITLIALAQNSSVYFNDFRRSYINSSLPYSDAGRTLQEFANSGGSLSNAFMIAYDFWWDHTIVGMEAGVFDWPNGIVSREDAPNMLYEARFCRPSSPYTLNPERDLLFFVNKNDLDTIATLRTWFPNGLETLVMSYQPNDEFKTYRVPALGATAFDAFLGQHTTRQTC